MKIEREDIKLVHYNDKPIIGIEVTIMEAPAIMDYLLRSNKVYNNLERLVAEDIEKCLCKSKAHCSYCKHRIQLEELLE